MSEAKPRLIFCGASALPSVSGWSALRELLRDNKPTLVLVPSQQLRAELLEEIGTLPDLTSTVWVQREIEGLNTLSTAGADVPNAFERQAIFRQVIEAADRQLLERVFHAGKGSAPALTKLYEELSFLNSSASEVAAALRTELRDEADRWEALTALTEDYERRLSASGLKELHDLPTETTRDRFQRVVLFGLCELTRLSEAVLSSWRGEVVAIVFASDGGGFDAWGRVTKAPDLQGSLPELIFVSHPREYAAAFLKQSNHGMPTTCATFQADEARYLAASLEREGVQVSSSYTPPLNAQPFGVFLRKLATASRSERLYDLLSLVRIRGVERYAQSKFGELTRPIIGLLDEYRQQYLQLSFQPPLAGKEHPAVKVIELLIEEFIKPLQAARTISGMCALLSLWLDKLQLDILPAGRGSLKDALESFCASRVQVNGPPIDLLNTLSSALAAMSVDCAATGTVHVCGLIDAVFDRRPELAIIGATDSNLPGKPSGSGFLSEGVRRALNFPLRTDRVERDRYLLNLLCSSRRALGAFVPRRTLADEYAFPSPLLLKRDELPEEILRFYSDAPRTIVRGGAEPALRLPVQYRSLERRTFAISEIDKYRRAPYEYYLEKVLGLSVRTDECTELDPLQFGSLAHEVLERMAKDPIRSSVDPVAIQQFFDRTRQRIFGGRYGKNVPAAVETQLIHLGERFAQLAEFQSQSNKDGWELWKAELNLGGLTFPLNGCVAEVHGRVDRVDRKGTAFRVWDYKTSEDFAPKLRPSRDGVECWASLQLPLYVLLLRSSGVLPADATIEVGYLSLSAGKFDFDSMVVNDAMLEEAHVETSALLQRIVDGEFAVGERENVTSEHRLAALYQEEYWEEEEVANDE